MRIPAELEEAMQAELLQFDTRTLAHASAELSQAYKSDPSRASTFRTPAHRLAYVLARMPATYGANVHVLTELGIRVPAIAPESALDVGAGPGSSLWAALEVFPTLRSLTAFERDDQIAALGQRFASGSETPALRATRWHSVDLHSPASMDPHDLVILSYSLGELPPPLRGRIVEKGWAAARQALIIIEPGTRRGFDVVLEARERLIAAGAQLAAPCPHELECPLAAAGDWCHFAQRIERTSIHRRIKDASLGYEDEKFSYVIATRLPTDHPRARIVRHPLKFSGHVKLQLCSGPILEHQTVTRSQKHLYKDARHADWGDAWNG